jgi:hypothetical protein
MSTTPGIGTREKARRRSTPEQEAGQST